VNRLFVGDRESEAALSLNTFKIALKKRAVKRKLNMFTSVNPLAYGSRTYICIDNKKEVTIALNCRSGAGMRFEWDENKNRRKLRKHGVRFETAVLVFDDPHALTLRDDRVAEEERWITVGAIGGGRAASRCPWLG